MKKISPLLRRMRVHMQEAGARNRKGDRERLVQIVVAAFDNMAATDQQDVLKALRKKAKKTGGGK